MFSNFYLRTHMSVMIIAETIISSSTTPTTVPIIAPETYAIVLTDIYSDLSGFTANVLL